jgi:hypothetical protein
MNNLIDKNCQHLEKELEWLQKIIQFRVAEKKATYARERSLLAGDPSSAGFLQRRRASDDSESKKLIETEGIGAIIPPTLQRDGTAYAGIVCENNLAFYDRLLLILTLSPHLDPLFLQDRLMENGERISPLWGGVRGSHSGVMLPTLQTFICLAAESGLTGRLSITGWLCYESLLVQAKVIECIPAQKGEVYPGGELVMQEYFLQLLLTNRSAIPNPNTLQEEKYEETRHEKTVSR